MATSKTPAKAKTTAKAPKPASAKRGSDTKTGREIAASPARRAAGRKPASASAKNPAAPAAVASKTAAATEAQRTTKAKKPKLVRDSFTMPEEEYAVLGKVKKACLARGVAVKKSELLRAGVALIGALDAAGLDATLAALMPIKTGRPKKNH